MALPDELVIQDGTAIVFGVSGSFSPVDPATQHAAAITDVLTLSALADGGGRQSDKVNLGASRAPVWGLWACVDFTGEGPTSGNSVDYFWLPSTSATQANGNVAGNSGQDGAAPDGALGSITLTELFTLAIDIGSFNCHDGGVVQNGFVNTFEPPSQWGQLLVINQSGDAFENDDVEMHHVIIPMRHRIID